MSWPDHRRRAPGMPAWRVALFWDIVRFALKMLFKILYGLRLAGAEHVPRTGPLIYAANHQSHYDPPLISVLVHDRPCAFLARASLFRRRPFALLIRMLNAIPLSREGGAGSGALRAALAELEAGRCVLMFPEGTRSRDGRVGSFHGGLALLVKRSGATVIPIAVEGAHDVWPHGRRYPRLRGRITVRAGPPITADEFLSSPPKTALASLRETIDRMRAGAGSLEV